MKRRKLFLEDLEKKLEIMWKWYLGLPRWFRDRCAAAARDLSDYPGVKIPTSVLIDWYFMDTWEGEEIYDFIENFGLAWDFQKLCKDKGWKQPHSIRACNIFSVNGVHQPGTLSLKRIAN